MSGSRCAAIEKPEAHVHARRVALHRRVDEVADAGELDDAFELVGDLPAPHAEDRAAQIDVLAAGQLGMEARPDFDQRRQACRGS